MSKTIKTISRISTEEREKTGLKVSYIGIISNIFLFILKFIAGILSGSIAIYADAVNNLSDFASSIIVLISFRIASRPPDREHPFGHARFEYMASGFVAMFILFLGFELGKSSIGKIINPVAISVSWFFYSVLILSIVVKFSLYFYYQKQSKLLKSLILKAAAKDSISDMLVNFGLICAILLGQIVKVPLDGYVGLGMSLFIVYSGVSILRKTTDRLLGKRPDREIKNSIKELILSKDGVFGIHDLIVHDYGADNYFATAHVEIDAAEDIMLSHNLIDQIEREVALQYNIHLVLHMDPIDLDNPIQNRMEILVEKIIRSLDSKISMHDFRMQEIDDHLHLIFDLKVPDEYPESNDFLREIIEKNVQRIDPETTCFITIDRNYATETVDLNTGDIQQY